MSKPEDLTMLQLKEELIAHGVKLPAKKLKAHYVELYYTHIVDKEDGTYSDDNVQVVTSSSKRSARKSKSAPKAPELDDLSNADIRSRLKDFGLTVGPIGPATRNVYLKKLARLLESGDVTVESPVKTHESYNDEGDSVPTVPVTRSSSRRRTIQSLQDEQPVISTRKSSSSTTSRRSMATRFNADDFSSQPLLSSVTKRRPLRSSTAATQPSPTTIVTQIKTKETVVQQESSETTCKEETSDAPKKAAAVKPERRWIPIWFQIIFTLLVVLFAYLVIRAMETPRPQLNLPSDHDGN